MTHGLHTAALRLVFAVAYPFLAHWASHREAGGGGVPLAAMALFDLALIVLVQPLMQRRGWAWATLALVALGLWRLAPTPYPQLLLLAPPVLFTGLLGWWFGRSLRAPRVAVITRIVAGLEQTTPAQLPPDLYRYTRRLTAAWAIVLACLALANTVLALIAVPDGVLARLGHAPVFAVSQTTWSWFANLLDYGIVGGFFVGEYLLRRRWFPIRPYRNFIDFLRRMAALGPGFWRQLFD
ncbi:MAG: COG4648 family protein [Lysobacter sp.]